MKSTSRARSVLLGAAGAFFVVTASFAFGLSDADFDYLATQQVLRESPVIRGLSPKELARLHAVINDYRVKAGPIAQARNVAELLEEFRGNQLWEKLNPGKLWDEKKK
jgi:hypothetical protein